MGNGNGMNPGSNQMGQYNAVGPLGLKGFVTNNGGGGYGGQVRGSLTPSPAHNPDFVVVYTFLAGLFDPKVKDHAEDLNAMSHIDRETTTLLMRNLSSNLMCPRMWEDQIQLIGRGCPTFVNATYDEKGVVSVNVPSGTVLHGGGIGRSGDDDEDGSGDGGGCTGVDVSGALKGSAGRHEEIQIRGVGGSHGTNKHGYVHRSSRSCSRTRWWMLELGATSTWATGRCRTSTTTRTITALKFSTRGGGPGLTAGPRRMP